MSGGGGSSPLTRLVGSLLGPEQCLRTLPLDMKSAPSVPAHSDLISGSGISGPISVPIRYFSLFAHVTDVLVFVN